MSADLIEKMAIVRDDDHRRIALIEHIFEPADGVDIKVVGRLVQQKNVGIREQGLRQQYSQLPARSNAAHLTAVLCRRYTYTREQFSGARFGSVAVVFGKFRLEIGCFHVIVVGRIRVRVNRIALTHRCPHFGMAHHHHIQHTHLFKSELILTQLAQTLISIEHHVAGGWLKITTKDFHEGGLAAAVGADQAVAIAIAEFD